MECLALYCYDNKSVEDIAEILGIGVPSVKTHLQRGRRKIEMAGLPKARKLQREPGEVLTNMDMDRIAPDEIQALW